MGRNDLRAHTHDKPGDGGYIDYAEKINDDEDGATIKGENVESGPTQVASGTETLAATSSIEATTGITDRETPLKVVSWPDASFGGSGFTAFFTDKGTQGSSDTGAALGWDGSSGEWKVHLRNDSNSEFDITWRVYEL